MAFSDPRDAEDAVRYRDNVTFGGGRLRVEVRGGGGRGGRDGGRYGGGQERQWDDQERRNKRQRDGSYGRGYGGGGYGGGHGGGHGDKKRDDSDGSHDDTVGHYKGEKGDVIVDAKQSVSYEVTSSDCSPKDTF